MKIKNDPAYIEKMKIVEDIKKYTEIVTKSPEKAKEFLLKTGVYDTKGNLIDELR